MQRPPVVLLFLAVLALLLPGAVVAGQEASPVASPVAGQPLDLAAMALLPTDVDLPNLGTQFGQTLTLEEEVAALVGNDVGLDPATVRAALTEASWQRSYLSRLQAPEELGAETPVIAQRINIYVREFTDAAGAAAGFAFLEDESQAPTLSSGATPFAGGGALAEDVPGTRVIGEESELTRIHGIGVPSGREYRALDLTFRVDNLVAGVGVYDYTGSEPDIALVEQVAQTYLERIEQVRTDGAPGLSTRMVRLDAPDILPSRDDYTRLNGVSIPGYNESAEAFAGRTARAGEATDVYYVSQSLMAGGEGFSDDVNYAGYIYRFPDEAAATAWLSQGAERLGQIGTVVAFAPVPEAATIGDESQTFAVAMERRSGYLTFARVGREVVDLRLFAQPEAPLALVEALAQTQVACLSAPAPCERVPVPAALLALAIPATPAAATPAAAATPVP